MSNIEQDNEIEEAAERIAGILVGEPKPRKSFDSYAHPETKERAWMGIEAVKEGEGLTIRDSRIVQPTEATVKESLLVQSIMPPTSEFKICIRCGSHFLPYKNGCIDPKICRDCMNTKIQKGMLKHHHKLSKKPMEDKQEQAPVLTLVFSGKHDARIYEAICAAAKNDRRTPENQVLHFLEMAFNGFGADVTFALEQTINREEN